MVNNSIHPSTTSYTHEAIFLRDHAAGPCCSETFLYTCCSMVLQWEKSRYPPWRLEKSRYPLQRSRYPLRKSRYPGWRCCVRVHKNNTSENSWYLSLNSQIPFMKSIFSRLWLENIDFIHGIWLSKLRYHSFSDVLLIIFMPAPRGWPLGQNVFLESGASPFGLATARLKNQPFWAGVH